MFILNFIITHINKNELQYLKNYLKKNKLTFIYYRFWEIYFSKKFILIYNLKIDWLTFIPNDLF